MREIPAKVWHYVVAIATGLVFVALSDLPVWPATWWRAAAIAVALTAILHLAWEHLLWRIPLVRRVTGRPDVRGTWRGVMESQFHTNVVADQGAECRTGTARIEVFAVIRQTASRIHVTMLAERSEGTSTAQSLYGDGSRAQAIVVYRNEPHHAGVLVAHFGTSLYTFQSDGKRIEARHWTDRFTRGTFASEERVAAFADSYPQAKRLFS